LEEYKKHSELIEADIYDEISLETCVEKRISVGGTGLESIEMQIKFVEEKL
jgi:argininosuccinate lyase